MTTAADEMRETLTDLKVPAKKIETIMERFVQLLADQQETGTVYVRGAHVAIETVEIYGLEIGLDATGGAATVSAAGIGPQILDAPEIEYGE